MNAETPAAEINGFVLSFTELCCSQHLPSASGLCNELAHDGGDSANDRAGVGGDRVLLHGVGDLSSARVRRVVQEDARAGEWVCNCHCEQNELLERVDKGFSGMQMYCRPRIAQLAQAVCLFHLLASLLRIQNSESRTNPSAALRAATQLPPQSTLRVPCGTHCC